MLLLNFAIFASLPICICAAPLEGDVTPGLFTTGTKGEAMRIEYDPDGGSGPYSPANFYEDPGLDAHTIYAPLKPPIEVKLPVIFWGNNLCSRVGTFMQNFLQEIASHGYIVVATGAPAPDAVKARAIAAPAQPTYQDGPQSWWTTLAFHLKAWRYGQALTYNVMDGIDWISRNGKKLSFASKYGTPDLENMAAAGHSCGGFEAYSAGVDDDRIKEIFTFNSGDFKLAGADRFNQQTKPIAYFMGGPSDGSRGAGLRDLPLLPPSLKVLIAEKDYGHAGSFFERYGGAQGAIAVTYANWRLKDNMTAKGMFTDPASSGFRAQGWNITMKNWV